MKVICYVCKKEIAPRKINPARYDPKHLQTYAVVYHGELVRRADLPVYIGQDRYRHESCAPGSAKWMHVQKRKRKKSEVYQDFLADEVKAS